MMDELQLPGLNFVVRQDHASYTVDDQRAWRLFLENHLRVIDRYPERFDRAYLDGLHDLKFSNNEIPTEAHLNQHLAPTGWRAVFVNGYLPPKLYMDMLLSRCFPVARNLRSLDHLDLSPTPDFLHDVFGHLPMLFCKPHLAYLFSVCALMKKAHSDSRDSELYRLNRQVSRLKSRGEMDSKRVVILERRLSQVQMGSDSSPSESALLERLFLWSIEFGLFGTPGTHQIYGAGLLSSPLEVKAVCSKTTKVLNYTSDVIRHRICFTGAQEQFFVASGYHQLHEVLDQIAADSGLLSVENG
jgi:phenylalanine-4-hydroxylase